MWLTGGEAWGWNSCSIALQRTEVCRAGTSIRQPTPGPGSGRTNEPGTPSSGESGPQNLDVWNRQCMAGSDALAPARGLTHKAKIREVLTMTRRIRHDWTNRPALTSAAGLFALCAEPRSLWACRHAGHVRRRLQSPCIGRHGPSRDHPRQPLKLPRDEEVAGDTGNLVTQSASLIADRGSCREFPR